MGNNDIIYKIRRGEIDLNNQSTFFGILIKGLLWDLNQQIQLRNKYIPHYIINTGDETLFTSIKGSDETANPLIIENENYIYTKIPRCVVTPKGISLTGDQCSNPYALGSCQYEDDDILMTLTSEFRRIPLTMSFDLEYLTDSYTDYLQVCQQIISKMAFVRSFDIIYMGQNIPCSYKIPDSFDGEYSLDFDLNTTDDKRKRLNLSIEVETVFPVFDQKTIITSDNYIKHIYTHGSSPIDSTTEHLDDKNGMFSSRLTVYPIGGINDNKNGEDPNK